MMMKLLQLLLFAVAPYFVVAVSASEAAGPSETAALEELVTALDAELSGFDSTPLAETIDE